MAKQLPPPFVLRVLTDNYLIVGTVPGNVNLNFPKPSEIGQPIQLTDARLSTTNTSEPVSHYCSRYTLWCNQVVAFIPETDFTQLEDYSTWKLFKSPLPGMFYLGPYLMTGKLMVFAPGSSLMGEHPIMDVSFEITTDGKPRGVLDAPFAIINCYRLQGWELV